MSAAQTAIEDRVKSIIAEVLGVNAEKVLPQASFIEDLGADSLDVVELVMSFEEEFRIEVADEEAEKFSNVGEVVEYIRKRLGNSQSDRMTE